MIKALNIRLYPTKQQEDYISRLLGCYRLVFNKCLDLKKTAYLESKKSLGLSELGNYFHQNLTKSEEFDFLNEHNTKVLKQSVINLLDSYKRFFVNGAGFPKFKSKNDSKQSCRFPVDAISKRNAYSSGKLTLTKDLKNVKFRCSDEYKVYLDQNKKNIRSATLTKTKSGKYFLSILVDGELTKSLPDSDKTIGIDLGIKDFVITSEGQTFKNIKIKRNNEKKLVKLNRSLSKKQKGSKNRNKARIKLARFHEKLNNQKENYLHSVTNTLLDENQIIAMENLSVSGMMKNHKLARSLQELSLYRFKSMLKYKANWYGRTIVEIDRFFPSSKLCSNCNHKNTNLKLSDRSWACPSCKTVLDRDLNAAKNILAEGLRNLNKIPIRDGKFTPLEIEPLALEPSSKVKFGRGRRKINKDKGNFVQVG